MCNGSISNCYVTGNITAIQNGNADIYSVGLVVFNRGIIENSYNLANVSATVTSDTNYSCYCAGITSNNEAETAVVKNCYNIGDITLETKGLSTAWVQMGGIARVQDAGTIENCYNIGEITCKTNKTTIDYCVVGSIIGILNDGENVKNVYNSGNVNIFSENQTIYAGGIVGENRGELVGSYNIGTISNINENAKCYIGEIFGRAKETAKSSNSFYINNQPIGENLSTSCVTTKVSSEQLKSDDILNLLNQNGVVWKKDTSNVNNGYPILEWQ